MLVWQTLSIAAAQSQSFGRDSEHIPAADAAAWVMLGLLCSCLLGFALAAFIIARRKKMADKNAGEILEDASSYAGHSSRSAPEEKTPPWERDPDWWKK